jgi:hypothetical protein
MKHQDPPSPLTPYEQQRQANIERNRALLNDLGLQKLLLHKEKQKPKTKVKRKPTIDENATPRITRSHSQREDVEVVTPTEEKKSKKERLIPEFYNFSPSKDVEDNIVRYCPRHFVIHDVSYGKCRHQPCKIAERHKTFPRDVRNFLSLLKNR